MLLGSLGRLRAGKSDCRDAGWFSLLEACLVGAMRFSGDKLSFEALGRAPVCFATNELEVTELSAFLRFT